MKYKKFVSNKIVFLVIMSVAMLALSGSYVFGSTATQELSMPLSSTLMNGTVTLNATINGSMYDCGVGGVIGCNVTLVNFTYINQDGNEIGACINRTNALNGSHGGVLCEFNSNVLFDTRGYNISAVIHNGSGATLLRMNSTSRTGVLVDNTVPVASITSPASGTTNSPGFSVAATCTNASNATLDIAGTLYPMAITDTADGSQTCSFSFGTDQPADRVYNGVVLRTIDSGGTNTTASSLVSWTVTSSGAGGGSGLAILAAQQGKLAVDEETGALSITGPIDFSGFLPGGGFGLTGATGLVLGVILMLAWFVPVIPPQVKVLSFVIGLALVAISLIF